MNIRLETVKSGVCSSRTEFYEGVELLNKELTRKNTLQVAELAYEFFKRHREKGWFKDLEKNELNLVDGLEETLERFAKKYDDATQIKIKQSVGKIHNMTHGHLTQSAPEVMAIVAKNLELRDLRELRGVSSGMQVVGEDAICRKANGTRLSEQGITTIPQILGLPNARQLTSLDMYGFDPIPPKDVKNLRILFPKLKGALLPPIIFTKLDSLEDLEGYLKDLKGYKNVIFEADFRQMTTIWPDIVKKLTSALPKLTRFMIRAKGIGKLTEYSKHFKGRTFHLELVGELVTTMEELESVFKKFINLEKLVIEDSSLEEIPEKLPPGLREIMFIRCPNVEKVKTHLKEFKGKITVIEN